MALNPNHIFEEVGEVKCSVIEKNCRQERVDFLKNLLELNGYTVVVALSPPPKAAPKPKEGEAPPAEVPTPPATFTIGVTDLSFNTMNAIYNRELRTKEGNIVTPEYWKQASKESVVGEWYWKK